MAFIESALEGSLNGTTAVEVVVAPAASTRRLVKSVHFCNMDTAAVTVVLRKKKGATSRELARETLQVNEYWTFDRVTVLDATDESMEALLSAVIATTNPTFDSAYADAT